MDLEEGKKPNPKPKDVSTAKPEKAALKLAWDGGGELGDRRGFPAARRSRVSAGEAHCSKGEEKPGPWEGFADTNVTVKLEPQVPAGKALSE